MLKSWQRTCPCGYALLTRPAKQTGQCVCSLHLIHAANNAQVIMIGELGKREAEDAELKFAAGAAVQQQQQEAATHLSLLAKRIKHAVR